MELIPVTSPEHVEWLRVQRSRPELYRFFRQDRPLTIEHQAKWWREVNKNLIRLFIARVDDQNVGYAGFNPFMQRSARAEFGLFIIPEYQGRGFGKEALLMLLKKGFTEFNLSTIYSDVLDYPGEHHFDFYKNIGFEAYPMEHQNIRYSKQGHWIPSLKFFMTKDIWETLHDKNNNGGLEPEAETVVRKWGTYRAKHGHDFRYYTGASRVKKTSQ